MDEQMIELRDALETELGRQGLRMVKFVGAQPDIRLIGIREGGATISLNELARAAHSVMAGRVAELEAALRMARVAAASFRTRLEPHELDQIDAALSPHPTARNE